MIEEIEIDIKTNEDNPFTQSILFKEPVTLNSGDTIIINFIDWRINYVVIKRKNSS